MSGSLSLKIKDFKWSEHSTGLAFILLFVLASIVGWPYFLQPGNLLNILRQQSYSGIIALGMTLVIISGGIDLSVGSMMAFVGGVSIFFMNWFLGKFLGSDFSRGDPAAVAAAASTLMLGSSLAAVFAMIFGTITGAVNGVLVTKAKIAPFIATLGTMSIFRSLIVYFSNAANIESRNPLYPRIGSFSFLGIYLPVWIFIILVVVLHLFLNNTRLGRYTCAVGANEQVARYSAININFVKLIPYAITGFTVAVSAVLWSSRVNAMQSSGDGTGYELDAIAAVVIGGTSMSGGKGSVIGTFMGAVMLGMINNMLVMRGFPSLLQQAARGVVIIAAVLLQYRNNK